jgi:hypothetical protein
MPILFPDTKPISDCYVLEYKIVFKANPQMVLKGRLYGDTSSDVVGEYFEISRLDDVLWSSPYSLMKCEVN